MCPFGQGKNKADEKRCRQNYRERSQDIDRLRPILFDDLGFIAAMEWQAWNLVKQILALSLIVEETVKLLRASIPATVDVSLFVTATLDTVTTAPVEGPQGVCSSGLPFSTISLTTIPSAISCRMRASISSFYLLLAYPVLFLKIAEARARNMAKP